MGRRDDQKAGTRERVITAASALFSKCGYDAVGIRDIARSIGMSTGAVCAHFPDKASLFTACMGRDPPMKRVREWLERQAAGTPFLVPRETPAQLLADLFGSQP